MTARIISRPGAAAIFCLTLLAGASCRDNRDGGGKEEILIITLHIPAERAHDADPLRDNLLRALRQERVGQVTARQKTENTLELTVRVRDPGSVNKIKKVLIEFGPGTEYRIEHL